MVQLNAGLVQRGGDAIDVIRRGEMSVGKGHPDFPLFVAILKILDDTEAEILLPGDGGFVVATARFRDTQRLVEVLNFIQGHGRRSYMSVIRTPSQPHTIGIRVWPRG